MELVTTCIRLVVASTFHPYLSCSRRQQLEPSHARPCSSIWASIRLRYNLLRRSFVMTNIESSRRFFPHSLFRTRRRHVGDWIKVIVVFRTSWLIRNWSKLGRRAFQGYLLKLILCSCPIFTKAYLHSKLKWIRRSQKLKSCLLCYLHQSSLHPHKNSLSLMLW